MEVHPKLPNLVGYDPNNTILSFLRRMNTKTVTDLTIILSDNSIKSISENHHNDPTPKKKRRLYINTLDSIPKQIENPSELRI